MLRHRRAVLLILLSLAGVVVGALSAGAANDPHVDRQWNMALVGAEQVWTTATGKDITIAVLDTGVDLDHEDFGSGKLVTGRDFVTRGTSPQDEHGHGTHVAGIAAASTNNGRGVVGVAPDARIMPVRVLSQVGVGVVDIDEAIRWSVDNGADVINMSLGDALATFSDDAPFTEALRYAWDRGVICVISAGNDADDASPFADEPVLVVAATDRSDRRAHYSSSIPEAQWGMAAPGGAGKGPITDDVFSTHWNPATVDVDGYPDYEYLAGTSMAAPHVSGAAALLRSLGLTPQQTVDRLLATAKDLGASGRDEVYGHGRLDVAKAVAGLGPSGAGTGGGGGSTTTTARRSSSGQGSGTSGTSGTSGAQGTNTSSGRAGSAGAGGGPDAPGTGSADDGQDEGDPADADDTSAAGASRDDNGEAGGRSEGARGDAAPDGRDGDGSGDGAPPWGFAVAVGLLVGVGGAAARARRRSARPTGLAQKRPSC